MAREIGDVQVVENGSLKIGALASIVLGVPIYALNVEYVRFLRMFDRGITGGITNTIGWFAEFVSVSISNPAIGFDMAALTFRRAVMEYGVYAFGVSIVVAGVVTVILIEGVTRVRN
jgi:hypothetical protein